MWNKIMFFWATLLLQLKEIPNTNPRWEVQPTTVQPTHLPSLSATLACRRWKWLSQRSWPACKAVGWVGSAQKWQKPQNFTKLCSLGKSQNFEKNRFPQGGMYQWFSHGCMYQWFPQGFPLYHWFPQGGMYQLFPHGGYEAMVSPGGRCTKVPGIVVY